MPYGYFFKGGGECSQRQRSASLLVPTLCVGMQIEPLLRFGTQERPSPGSHAEHGNQEKSLSIPFFKGERRILDPYFSNGQLSPIP
jgi:hypothetical protein